MLTQVRLEGAMGERFGYEWELDVNSAHEALRIINANVPGVFGWIKQNLDIYAQYKVICTYDDGRNEELDENEYVFQRKCKSITFVPIVQGSGSTGKIIVGVVLMVVGYFVESPTLIRMGAVIALSGVIEALTPQPKIRQQDQNQRRDKTSYYFDGPVNTTGQGIPVPLIYGRVLVGSHAISAAVTINQM